jgi:multicomponent Na+:H+ antiporter subunit G
MSPRGILVAALLVVGVGVTLASCVGVLVMRNAYDRLHFTSAATTIAPLTIAAAILVEEGLSAAGVKSVLVAVVLLVTNPVLTHATARAARIREFGEWTVQPGEHVKTEGP